MFHHHLRRQVLTKAVATSTAAKTTTSTTITTTAQLLNSLRFGWGDAKPINPEAIKEQQQDDDTVSFSFDFGEAVPEAPDAGIASTSYSLGASAGASSTASTMHAVPGSGFGGKSASTAASIMPPPQPAGFGATAAATTSGSSAAATTTTSSTENAIYTSVEADENSNANMETPCDELVQLIRSYLDQNVPTMENVERNLFTALISRREEFTPDQLLDVLEKKFPYWVAERGWGDKVKAMIRDRCFREASGMKPLTVARAIVLVGLNGRARRDVEFFKKLCKILSININEIKDPHTLCYVLVALQNSRIKPPENFLALVGRRFPVLNKKNPLHALPAYRALTFFSRSEYPLMNPYRYLADRIMSIVRDRLRLEGKGEDFDGIGKKIESSGIGSRSSFHRDADGEELDTIDDVSALTDEDLDILKGLQREDASKRGEPEIPSSSTTAAAAGAPTSSSMPGWGNASSAFGSAWGTATTTATASPTANTTTISMADTEMASQTEGGDDSDDSSSLTNQAETSLRGASAIPKFLQAADETTGTATATTSAEEGDQDQQQQSSKEQEENASKTKSKIPQLNRKPPSLNPNSPEFLLAQFSKRTGGLTPQQFVRFLFILGLKKAPRQQYLRPVATDLLVPVVPVMTPPTFMRLVVAMRMFHSEDKKLLTAVIDRMVKEGGSRVCLRNVFELLRLFGNKDSPIEVATPHLSKFFEICKGAFQDESRLRARDMLAITGELRNIHQKLTASVDDDWLGAVEETSSSTEEKQQNNKEDSESNKNKQVLKHTEQLFSIVERFASRMTNLLSLGVLALTNAETLLEICRTLPPQQISETTANALEELKQARQRIDDEDGGPDAYADILDIDVREIFFRIQVINNFDTFRNFRPLPATLIQDFKGMLDAMRCDYIVEAVHLYEQAFPGTLAVPVKRVLARHIFEKMEMELRVLLGGEPPKPVEASQDGSSSNASNNADATAAAGGKPKLTASGKIIEVERAKAAAEAEKAKLRDSEFRSFGAAAARFHMKIIDDAIAAGVPKKFYEPYDCTRPKYQMMVFNAKKFLKFVNMLSESPLKRVRNSKLTWIYVEKKAEKLNLLIRGDEELEEGEELNPISVRISEVLKERREFILKQEMIKIEMEIKGNDDELKKQREAEL